MEQTLPVEKERIMKIAASLFGEKGYAATSVRDIAHELNVSIATIYYYFRNKEDLLFSIIESIGNDLLAILNKCIQEYKDPVERLRQMLMGHVRLGYEKKHEVKVYVEEQGNLSKKYKNIIYKQHRGIYDIYVDQLKELQKLKLMRFENLPVVAFAMFGMVNWCYRWYKDDGKWPIDKVSETLIDLFYGGILKNPGRSTTCSTENSSNPR